MQRVLRHLVILTSDNVLRLYCLDDLTIAEQSFLTSADTRQVDNPSLSTIFRFKFVGCAVKDEQGFDSGIGFQ